MKHQPNILIISTHDTGRHFGCYGVPTVRTPAIDGLAASGVKFNRMFAASPICSPSRGALLSGQYPLTNGLVGLAGGNWNWELADYRVHLSHRLQQLGYHTAMFGLQDETAYIERMGFDDTSCHGIKRDGRERPATEVADDFCAFLTSREDGKPFYAQVGFFETHTPYTFGDCPSDDEEGVWIPPYAKAHDWAPWQVLLNRFGGDLDAARQHVAELQGAVRRVDAAVETILEGLRKAGVEDNTLVLFTSDHGPELPGAKWTMYEAGLGVAFIMRWPDGGVSGGRECDWLLSNVDFLPTLYDLFEVESPDGLEGESFALACRGDSGGIQPSRDVVFSNWIDGLNFSVRTHRYKLIRNLVPVDSTGRECQPYELYDLDRDPLELTNVADEPAYAEPYNMMRGHLDRWLVQMDDPTVHGELTVDEHDKMIAEYRRRYEQSREVLKRDIV
jgi:arylsulfatase A-like enzyme